MPEQPVTDTAPIPPAPSEPPDVHLRTRVLRADWWRLASHRPGERPEPGARPIPTSDTTAVGKREDAALADRAIRKDAAPADNSSEDPEDSPDEPEPEQELGPWDPVAIADRIVQSQKERTLADRARDLATATKAGPRPGRLVYAASGAWAAWNVGLTPWLLSVTSSAPLGVLVGLVLVGWALHRRSARAVLPVAWCGHALFTATVITLTPHL